MYVSSRTTRFDRVLRNFVCILLGFSFVGSVAANTAIDWSKQTHMDVKTVSGQPVRVYPSTIQAANDGVYRVTADYRSGTVARRATLRVSTALNPLLTRIAALRNPLRWVAGASLAAELATAGYMWRNPDGSHSPEPMEDGSVPVVRNSGGSAMWYRFAGTSSKPHPSGTGNVTSYGPAPYYSPSTRQVTLAYPDELHEAIRQWCGTCNPASGARNLRWYEEGGSLKQGYLTTQAFSASYCPHLGLEPVTPATPDEVIKPLLPPLSTSYSDAPPAELERAVMNAIAKTPAAKNGVLPFIVDGVPATDLFEFEDTDSAPVTGEENTPVSPPSPTEPELSEGDPSLFAMFVPREEINPVDWLSIGHEWLPRQCPGVVVLGSVFGKNISFDYSPVCSVFDQWLSVIVMIIAWLVAIRNIVRGVGQ